MSNHWKIPPLIDHRAWLPLAARGVPAKGHNGLDEAKCFGCHPLAPLPPLRASKGHIEALPPPVVVLPPPVVVVPPPLIKKVRRLKKGAKCPQREMVVIALVELWTLSLGPVDEESLILKAWELDPVGFGFGEQWRKHPSDKRVTAKICGEDGILGRGWATRVGPKKYLPTDAGRKIWREYTAVTEIEIPRG